MFEIEPDYNIWSSFIKIICLIIGLVIWSKLAKKWLDK